MKRSIPLFVLLLCGALAVRADFCDYALPIVGTDNTRELSSGNLYPCIARPWGAHAWTPQTGDNETGWIYSYGDRRIRGIRLTHQPSPWIGDYGQFSLLPAKGLAKFDHESRASWFSHKTESARPHLYRVYLADFDTTVEVSPTCNAAILRATYPETDAPQFVIDAFPDGEVTRTEGRVVEGVSRAAKVRWNEKRREKTLENFFRIEFDRDPVSIERQGEVLAVRFAPVKRGERIEARVAASFVSPEQASLNLREVSGKPFEQVVDEGAEAWNAVLSRISLEDDDLDRKRMFYTCLYRALLFPRRFFDIGPDGKPVHRSPHTLEVKSGRYYCDTGFWDTFRSLFPLLNFAYPEMNREMTEGLIHCFDEGGWLPEWSSPGYRHCMIGNNSASVVADAFLSGAAEGLDTNRLYAAMLKNANGVHPEIRSEGRLGFEAYNEKGYVPRDIGINESAARTLEYAYDDWCIWRLGTVLGRPREETDVYLKRSGNWRNVFDPKRRLACGRNKDGSFDANFNPYKWGGDFTEGNALHYTWSVFHDIAALVEAMGGREAFAARLDSIFTLPPVYDESYYKSVIHEIREMQIMGFGQYAHGNQPIQHMIYMYNYSGEPWKAQHWLRETMNRMYNPNPDGYCGDEDNGQTSAWYVFTALGFYPVCPGADEYVMGAPYFQKMTLTLENGKKVVINAPENSDKNRYVKELKMGGKAYEKNYIKHGDLLKGATLDYVMDDKPNKKRGTSADAAPYSFTKELKGIK